ncbi:hypothetical protein DPMN_078593 [Dreissena polymorpha]|uniref:Uncharacterized protein n=1 Tax=Dreissena polymorpha TaxID=45954 RepID=A0A9D3YS52_DREPO|nr:hypothetical protein DPMN_078593 [Dreissena polymorpha]
MDTLTAQIQTDSDFEVEPELPSLKQLLGEDTVRKLKPKEKKRQDVINGECWRVYSVETECMSSPIGYHMGFVKGKLGLMHMLKCHPLLSPTRGGGILCWRCPSVSPAVRQSVRHFCVQSLILEVLWRISLKLGMSIYMHKRMMHAKWHCTPYVKNRLMALCILLVSAVCTG